MAAISDPIISLETHRLDPFMSLIATGPQLTATLNQGAGEIQFELSAPLPRPASANPTQGPSDIAALIALLGFAILCGKRLVDALA